MRRKSLTPIGYRIRRLREKGIFNFKDFAKFVGLNANKLYDIENGFIVPDYTTLLRLADIFGISIAELTKGDTIEDYKNHRSYKK